MELNINTDTPDCSGGAGEDSLLQIRSLLELSRQSEGAGSLKKLHQLLLQKAAEAAERSYSPYSEFPVGAALLAGDGTLFTGCNVENASYGGTICAERTAIVKAVSEGYREFLMIAVVCKKSKDSWPCGNCRQFISEFGANITVIAESSSGGVLLKSISELLPEMFGPGALGR